ncbi:CopG domain protein DNA-binding domain protein [Haladaptatus paucihalophilus DX253]|uniref:Antitoxin component YafN of the YafNO toxin-antitoxin module, PHD/YefM family n=1 Tax=Haladaptatus paucihalophilus DX253 TaxID=797209 RepID=E7QSY5_HALPU|nr:CopG domain protein DNA-binding domain protein [Haladaptatus paucihalophilus DX253]SHL61888.1 Antitoxin component YafN of the YafNO toxin-antitoxin module, PHD/YefM family [Haladaptatus paucihalophilus DX253]
MSTGTNDNDDIVKFNMKVPNRPLDELYELAAELNYTNRSGFIRDVLQDITEPISTSGAQEGVSQGYVDVEARRTMSITEAKDRHHRRSQGVRTDECTTSF